MDFINDVPQIDDVKPKKEHIYINKNGKVIANDRDKVYAQVLVENNRETHYIVTYQNSPLDPMGRYQKRQAYLETKMTRVAKKTFDFYVTYLQTNNSIYLTRTNRSYQNG
tara:strand:+ start:485 stop:814 length:330 start_codon:yes stop_codon:yes gene_type:complete